LKVIDPLSRVAEKGEPCACVFKNSFDQLGSHTDQILYFIHKDMPDIGEMITSLAGSQ
jgi:hypothetical protein